MGRCPTPQPASERTAARLGWTPQRQSENPGPVKASRPRSPPASLDRTENLGPGKPAQPRRANRTNHALDRSLRFVRWALHLDALAPPDSTQARADGTRDAQDVHTLDSGTSGNNSLTINAEETGPAGPPTGH